jgi:hypothetical protein
MATEDLSRAAYYPQKRYSGVRMQQGRILTDDDFNEQQRINHEDKRLTNRDVIGNAGTQDQGFTVDNISSESGSIDFDIAPGTFHIGGIRVALDEPQSFKLQTDWLQRPVFVAPGNEQYDMVYLEVWQQNVSSVEDSELIEKALGGPDTSTRLRTMCRVKLHQNVDNNNCSDAWQQVKSMLQNTIGGVWRHSTQLSSNAKLTVGYEDNGDQTDLCSPSVQGGYLSAENQAIRLQLVDPHHFTWGFDNGAPLYRVTLIDFASDRKAIKILTEPKDQAHWPHAGQVVELMPWSAVLFNGEKLAEELSPGHYSTLSDSYDPGSGEIHLTTAVPSKFGEQWKDRSDQAELLTTSFGAQEEGEYFFLRVWDRGSDTSSSAKITVGSEVVLGNTGLNVSITGSNRMPGDHWIIAARPHTPDQVVPWQLEVQRPPEGYRRFYAPLAIIHWNAPGEAGPVVYDCRKKFPSLTNISANDVSFDNNLCTLPDADTVQDAIDILCHRKGSICQLVPSPVPGWENIFKQIRKGDDVHICFQTGIYQIRNTVVLKKLGHVKITGSGFGTQLVAKKAESALRLEHCKSVYVQNLAAVSGVTGVQGPRKALNGTLTMVNCPNVTVENVHFKCAAGTRKSATCLTVKNMASGVSLAAGKGQVRIRHCDFSMGHLQVGILLVNVARAQIEDNYLTVAPKPKRFSFERLLKDKDYRARLRKMLIADASIGVKAEIASKRNTTVRFGNFYAHFNTHESLVPDWSGMLEENPPKENRVRKDRDLLTHLERMADRILINRGIINGSLKARAWYQSIKLQNPAVAAQGIVIGGQRATDIRVVNNTIHGVLEGVHVGVSHREAPTGTYDYIGRLKIENNTINIVFAPVAFKERYGIFIGNCNSCIVANNYIRVKRFLSTLNKHIEGVRVFGHSGRMIFLRENHLEHFTVGIYFNPLNQFGKQLFQWAVIDNLAPNASQVVEIGARPKPGETEAKKQERLKRNAELKKIIRQAYNFS